MLNILECHLLALCPLAVFMSDAPVIDVGVVSTRKRELSGHYTLLYVR